MFPNPLAMGVPKAAYEVFRLVRMVLLNATGMYQLPERPEDHWVVPGCHATVRALFGAMEEVYPEMASRVRVEDGCFVFGVMRTRDTDIVLPDRGPWMSDGKSPVAPKGGDMLALSAFHTILRLNESANLAIDVYPIPSLLGGPLVIDLKDPQAPCWCRATRGLTLGERDECSRHAVRDEFRLVLRNLRDRGEDLLHGYPEGEIIRKEG